MALAGNAKGGQRASGVFRALEMVKIFSFLITTQGLPWWCLRYSLSKFHYLINIGLLSVDFLEAKNFAISSLVTPFKPVILENWWVSTATSNKKSNSQSFESKSVCLIVDTCYLQRQPKEKWAGAKTLIPNLLELHPRMRSWMFDKNYTKFV